MKKIESQRRPTAIQSFDGSKMKINEAFYSELRKRLILNEGSEMKVQFYRDLGIKVSVFKSLAIKSKRSKPLSSF